MLCQAKIGDFSIAALGSLMETLHISEDSQIDVYFLLFSLILRNVFSTKNPDKSIYPKFYYMI